MAEIVNSTYTHSLEWQKPLTWLRINIAYIHSELEELATIADENTEQLTDVVKQFDSALEEFTQAEMRLFVEARTSERSPHINALSCLLIPLFEMRDAFDASQQAFHMEVIRQRSFNPNSSTLALCHCCGAEIFGARNEVREAIDRFITQIEDNLR